MEVLDLLLTLCLFQRYKRKCTAPGHERDDLALAATKPACTPFVLCYGN